MHLGGGVLAVNDERHFLLVSIALCPDKMMASPVHMSFVIPMMARL